MDRERVVSLVRKLLRLTRSKNPNEARLARTRAEHLMDKHGVRVEPDDVDDHSVTVEAEAFWHEQVLSAVAEAHRCAAFRAVDGKRSVLTGAREDVEVAVEDYRHGVAEVSRRSVTEWDRFRRSNGDATEWLVAACKPVWFRAFVNGAAFEIIRRLVVVRARPVAERVKSEPGPISVPKSTAADEDLMEAELDKLDAEAARLSKLLPPEVVQQVVNAGNGMGIGAGRAISWGWRDKNLLAARSSIPVTRFTFLEVD
jgi:hypothetical protein